MKRELEIGNGRDWRPYLWIIAASALAHLWCLGSQFYMDDRPGILENELIRSGRFWKTKLLAWTHLGYVVQSRLFGFSAAEFHAVNWVLHTAVACVLFGFGRDFIKDRWSGGVALFGALWFAVHPLGSEIPNYVRTQDLAWVTLFSLLACWCLLRFLREGSRAGAVGCVVFLAGATISKGPGLFHALMMTGAVGLASVPASGWQVVRRRPWQVAAAVVLVAGGGLWLSGLLEIGLERMNSWSDPRFIGHGYTLARVFWEFAWRAVVPVALSADHHIAETMVEPGTAFWNIPDKGAMLAAVAMLALAAASVVLAWLGRTRHLGVCLFLFTGTILFRVLYLIPEFMPEYRIYPGLPWFCLGGAIFLAGAWKWMFPVASPRIPAVVMLAVLAVLSAKRSFQWHDLDRLMADVLEQYPAQGRAVWELHDRDLGEGNYQAIIDRHEKVWPEVRRKFLASLEKSGTVRQLPTGHFSLAEVAATGRYARATGHLRGAPAGLMLMAQLEAYMQALRIDPETNPTHWRIFDEDKALLLEMAGKPEEARKQRDLRDP